jgi:hypothetical protein
MVSIPIMHFGLLKNVTGLHWLINLVEETLKRFHGDYRTWIVGHIEEYLLRPNDKALNNIRHLSKDIDDKWKNPVVGY